MKTRKTSAWSVLLTILLSSPVWADDGEVLERNHDLTIDFRRNIFSPDYEFPAFDGAWPAAGTGKAGTVTFKGPGTGFAADAVAGETRFGGLGGGVGSEMGLSRGYGSAVLYASPGLHGFRLVGSYSRDQGWQTEAGPFLSSFEQWTTGLNFGEEYAGIEYGADVFIGKRIVTNGLGFKESSFDQSGVGMGLAYGGFSLGGSYSNTGEVRVNGFAARTNLLSRGGDVITVETGYRDGPYQLKFSYLDADSGDPLESGGIGDFSSLQLTGIYELDHNVEVNGSAFFAKFNDESMTRSSNDNAWAAVIGIRMTF